MRRTATERFRPWLLALGVSAALALAGSAPAQAQVCGDATVDAGEGCDDGNVLDGDCCSSVCAIEPSSVVCRPSLGVCDVAESCDGVSPTCPADAFAEPTTECRASAGGCDPAEHCDGAGVCPGDSIFPAASVCRATAGACDVAETCDGVSPACPADAFAPSATTCRPTAGVCDVAETCTGSEAACPADALVGAGTPCRSEAGACDVAEACDGASVACPADAFAPSGTICRSAAGVCDSAEACTGAAAACPADAVLGTSTICRAAASNCDLAEACNGSAVDCPADALVPNGTVCNDGDICSSSSTCSSGTCTGAGATAGGQVCRPIAGPCDIAETCSGTTPTCPADGFRPIGSSCRAAAGACDVAEICNGLVVSCPPDAKSTNACRPAATPCDVAEFCDGVGNHCPSNQAQPNGTFCADEGNPCTRDTCLNGNCAHTAGNTGAICRAALDACDVPETCDGVSQACPADVTTPDGIACDDGQSCTGGDACDAGQCLGTSLTCGNGTVECGEECDDANTNDGDDCSASCRFTEICSDLVDNEPDGRIDCLDPECAGVCGSLVNGGLPPRPSRIIFKRSLDLFRMFGAIVPPPTLHPSTSVFGISISNQNGVLFSAKLPAGALDQRGDKRWVARNPIARVNGGVFSVTLVRDVADSQTVIRFALVGFGELSGATLAQMSVQVVLGDHAALHTSSWQQLKSGWKVELP